MNLQHPKFLLFIGLLAIVGVGFVWYATGYGIGASPDSVIYIGAARNLLAGAGLTVPVGETMNAPLTQYPPLYPIFLAVSGIFQADPYAGARWLSALLFAANIFLTGFILLRLLPQQPWLAILGAGLILLSPGMVGIHVMAWSEPLFILLSLLALVKTASFLDFPGRRSLVWAGILTGLALLTRYAGISLAAAGVMGIIWLGHGSFYRRLRDSLIFGLISIFPLLVFLVYNQFTNGTATNREIGFHPVTRAQLWEGLTTVTGWFGAPQGLPTLIYVVFLGGLILLFLTGLFFIYRRTPQTNTQENNSPRLPALMQLMGLYTLIYGMFLLVSITFLDANTPLDNRILAPIFPMLIILLICCGAFIVKRIKIAQRFAWSFVIIAGGLLVIYGAQSMPELRQYHQSGIGLSAPGWQKSGLIEQVKRLPPGLTLYSNAPDAIYLLTGKPAARLPRKFELSAQRPNADFAAEIAAIGKEMADGKAMIVFFTQTGRLTNPSEDDLKMLIPMHHCANMDDGIVYAFEITPECDESTTG
jgi:uncharacterized membrane protein